MAASESPANLSSKSTFAVAASLRPMTASARTPESFFASEAVCANRANRAGSASAFRYRTASSCNAAATGACKWPRFCPTRSLDGRLQHPQCRGFALIGCLRDFIRRARTAEIFPESILAFWSPSSRVDGGDRHAEQSWRQDLRLKQLIEISPGRFDSLLGDRSNAHLPYAIVGVFQSGGDVRLGVATPQQRRQQADMLPRRLERIPVNFLRAPARRDSPYCAAWAVAGSMSSRASVSSGMLSDWRR